MPDPITCSRVKHLLLRGTQQPVHLAKCGCNAGGSPPRKLLIVCGRGSAKRVAVPRDIREDNGTGSLAAESASTKISRPKKRQKYRRVSRPPSERTSEPEVLVDRVKFVHRVEPVVSPESNRWVLVDGNNVVNGCPLLKEILQTWGLDAAKRKLNGYLREYARLKRCRVLVVYDAVNAVGPTDKTVMRNGLQVVHSRHCEADTYIEDWVDNHLERGAPGSVLVISNDRRVIEASQHYARDVAPAMVEYLTSWIQEYEAIKKRTVGPLAAPGPLEDSVSWARSYQARTRQGRTPSTPVASSVTKPFTPSLHQRTNVRSSRQEFDEEGDRVDSSKGAAPGVDVTTQLNLLLAPPEL